jgi:hypothetical protein
MANTVKKIVFLFLMLSISALQAQKTPEELADYLFKALKAENVKAVGTYLATPEEALLFSKKLGYSYTKDQGDDYKEEQLKIDTAFIDQVIYVLKDGKTQKGIVWNKAELVKIKSGVETYILSSLDESKTADWGPISIIFKSGTDQFILTFANAFDATGRWRINGESIKLKRYTE